MPKKKPIVDDIKHPKNILDEFILDRTDLDEKAQKTVEDVEFFLRERKDNLKFVWDNFRYVAYILLVIGAVGGLGIGYAV